MPDNFLVSIVITTRNRCEMLKRAINSALRQSIPCEVIVVDDNSSDGTEEFCKSLGGQIKYIRNAKQEGHSNGVNKGVASAAGEWIKVLDDDDFLLLDCIETVLRNVSKLDSCVICSHLIQEVDQKHKVCRKQRLYGRYHAYYISRQDSSYAQYIDACPIGETSRVLFKRQAFLEVGCWNSSFDYWFDDIDSWIRIAQLGDTVFINEVLAFRTIWEQNNSAAIGAIRKFKTHCAIKERIKNFISGERLPEVESTATTNDFLRLFWFLIFLRDGRILSALELSSPGLLSIRAWKLLFKTIRMKYKIFDSSKMWHVLTVKKNSLVDNRKLDFTVAIPVYNGTSRLGILMEALKNQVVPDSLSWEIIVVDNNSTDSTAELIKSYQASWPAKPALRYVFEPTQGLAFARNKAVEEAGGTYVGFIDDDVLPSPDWVEKAYLFGNSHPDAGAWGSRVQARFEAPPSGDIKAIERHLAIEDRGIAEFMYRPEKFDLPPGAALVIRKEAWLKAAPERVTLKGGPPEAKLIRVRGDDYELLLHMHKAGWQIWYNPAMNVQHCMPSWRLQPQYLEELCLGNGLATFPYRVIITPAWARIPAFFKRLIGGAYKYLKHRIIGHKKTDSGIAEKCERNFLLGYFLSPFYYLYIKLIKRR